MSRQSSECGRLLVFRSRMKWRSVRRPCCLPCLVVLLLLLLLPLILRPAWPQAGPRRAVASPACEYLCLHASCLCKLLAGAFHPGKAGIDSRNRSHRSRRLQHSPRISVKRPHRSRRRRRPRRRPRPRPRPLPPLALLVSLPPNNKTSSTSSFRPAAPTSKTPTSTTPTSTTTSATSTAAAAAASLPGPPPLFRRRFAIPNKTWQTGFRTYQPGRRPSCPPHFP
mmetsp:Transcript_32621/g.69988  ORF Transcript_32621/g.69988 Transcript_32621/m.69988 type:complete len:224 (+) Transcript_32621:2848-3519(+)